MRLVTFVVATPVGAFERLGAQVDGGRIVDLNAAFGSYLEADGEAQPARLASVVLPPEMVAFLEMGATSMDARLPRVRGAHARRLRAAKRAGPRALVSHAVPYKGNHRTVVGPDANVRWPSYTERLDYELELACVIGRRRRDLGAEEAGAWIAGDTVMNDWSARDVHRSEMMVRVGPAKGKDFATSLGPCLVTADELDARNLRMTARINGELWSDGNSGTSHWTFPQMIAHVARDEDVWPGDVLGSGTVGGGCGLELDRWLAPGDVVELEIEGISVLRNRVVKG
jgi:2-keto-4-pentenoate hydratase/2-oxohepta-3-ene-1,7-dioic acid hydratase in catechol pathway